MGYCNFCGKENPNGSKFCNYCGKQMFGEVEETIKYDNYSVSLYSVGNNKIKVVEALQKWFNCSLQEAFDKAENLPVLLKDNCNEETALSIVREWQRLGAGVRQTVEDETQVVDEEIEVPVKKTSKKAVKQTSKIAKPQLLKLISSLLFLIGTALFLFLPLVFDYVDVGEGTVEKPYSLFNLVYTYASGLISGKIKLTFTSFGIIYILATAMCFAVWCTTALNSVKAFIFDVKNIKSSGKTSLASKIGLKSMLSLAGNFLIMFFFMSFDGLIYLNVIIIAVIVIVATILEKIALK